MTELDIVIPVYNSTKIIADLINRLNEWSATIDLSFRVIFVDDGSEDDSDEIIIAAPKKFDYKLICLARNYGQHTATAIGLGYSDADLVATMDDDSQHDPFELTKMMEQLKNDNADLVFGTYNEKQHSIIRNFGSLLLKKIFHLEGIDYSGVTSFRLMQAALTFPFKRMKNPIVFIDEYLVKNAKKISLCDINHKDRISGNTSYSSWKLFTFAINIILFHSSFPLKFTTRLGLLLSIFFFGLGAYYIYDKVFNDVQLGFTSIIVAIFFSTGILLMSIGVIGEYIRKLWITQNKVDQIIVLSQHEN